MFGIDDIFNSIYNNLAADNRAELATHNNALMAQKNRDWQEKMQREQWLRDDTQYQRMVNDMSTAGLNPLSGASPQSSGLSVSGAQANAVMANPSPMNFNLDGLLKIIGFQEQLSQNEKRINLDAIRNGISPNALGGDDKDIVKLFNDIAQNNLKILKKEANSPYSRSEGNVEKSYKGFKNIVEDVNKYVENDLSSGNKVLDTLSDGPKGILKRVGKRIIKASDNLINKANKKIQEEEAKRNERKIRRARGLH